MKTLRLGKKGQIVPFGFMRKAAEGDSTISSHPTLTTDLVSVWEFNGDATDSFGSNDGTVSGATFVAGLFGQCADFDGVNDKIYAADDATLDLNKDWSISYWYYLDSKVSNSRFYHKSSGTGSAYALSTLAYDTNHALFFNDGAYRYISSGIAMATGAWVHITWTRNSTGHFQCYVDTTASSVVTTQTGNVINTDGDLNFGQEEGGTTMNGRMQQILIHSRVLTSGEVSDLVNGGAGLPYD